MFSYLSKHVCNFKINKYIFIQLPGIHEIVSAHTYELYFVFGDIYLIRIIQIFLFSRILKLMSNNFRLIKSSHI